MPLLTPQFLANETMALPTATASITVPQTVLPPGAQTAIPSSLIPVLPSATATLGLTPTPKSDGTRLLGSSGVRGLAIVLIGAVVAQIV